MVLILQKGLKSLQLRVNEMMMALDKKDSVSNSAFTQARANLKHTAFIELNKKAVIDVMYDKENEIKLYKGMRVLGIDGSKIRLPDSKSIIEEFGTISYSTKNLEIKGSNTFGLASVMYDVLNHIAVDSILAKAKSYEVDLAIEHLKFSSENDLLIYDRNYPSYRHLARLLMLKKKFVIRCSSASFKEARVMLKGEGADSQIVTLNPHHTKIKEIQDLNLPQSIKVRFIRVRLSTGEYEVLVTSLINEEEFPTDDFLDIYYLRWGIESFYGVLKNRLNLENFSGKTAESVYQDFYSTIYLSGLETILTEDINEELADKETKNQQQINHAVSFNAIKNKALDLLFSDKSSDEIIEQLEILFRTNPVQIRKNRQVVRKKSSDYHLYHHLKRKQKICY